MSKQTDKKILILDIDGTLVNSKKVITEKTLNALLRIQEEGHIVALASGRPYSGMEGYAKQLKLDYYGGYALSFNGAKIINCATMETVFENPLGNKFINEIYGYAIENKLGLVTYKGNLALTGTPIDDYMIYESNLNNLTLTQVDDFIGSVDFDMIKCLLTSDVDSAPTHEENLKTMLPELNVFRSEPYFIEITKKGVDKAESIDKLLKILDINREASICCGDGFNDLTMVMYAGVGVAMDNAQQIVKDNADYVTASCDDDGLVEVIEKFIL